MELKILDYLKKHGGIYTDMIAVLKSHGPGGGRNISNAYINARVLNQKDDAGRYVHYDFLHGVGASISEHAKRLGANMIIGVVTTGATLAEFAGEASGIRFCSWNPHDEDSTPDADLAGKNVLVVDDTTTTGASISDCIKVCEAVGANVVGALTLVRRDPEKVREEQVGLNPNTQEFVSLLDIDFKIVIEEANDKSILLRAGLPVRLDIGYAATDDWPNKYPNLTYEGEPNTK
ncbi:hypothetical protein FWH13_03735 [Candidatus Saccharibacteria bacterium]|nr:hypothetical protein [Candidatus Saccharibacteria bacterium]